MLFDDPTGHAYPAEHGPEHDDDDCPGSPYRPALHGPVQLGPLSPSTAPYRPAGQLSHAKLVVFHDVPAKHDDGVDVVDPGGHVYPFAHGPLHDEFVNPSSDP